MLLRPTVAGTVSTLSSAFTTTLIVSFAGTGPYCKGSCGDGTYQLTTGEGGCGNGQEYYYYLSVEFKWSLFQEIFVTPDINRTAAATAINRVIVSGIIIIYIE